MNQKYKLVEKKFFPEINKELWQIEAFCGFGYVKKVKEGVGLNRNQTLIPKEMLGSMETPRLMETLGFMKMLKFMETPRFVGMLMFLVVSKFTEMHLLLENQRFTEM